MIKVNVGQSSRTQQEKMSSFGNVVQKADLSWKIQISNTSDIVFGATSSEGFSSFTDVSVPRALLTFATWPTCGGLKFLVLSR